MLALAALAAACTSSGREQERSQEHIQDAAITARVKNALFMQSGASGFEIEVDTRGGIVQLTGSVPSAAERARAETAARSVDGVRGVNNGLIVKSR